MKMRNFAGKVPVFLCAFFVPLLLFAGQSDSTSLQPGAIEVGVTGSLTAIEGNANATVSIRTGTFFTLATGLAGIDLEIGYSHVKSLNLLDVQSNLSWQIKFARSPVYPFIAVGGGLRQEWLGSFQQIRYPVGLSLGLRILLSQSAGIRFEYRFRRIFHDPVSDFTEQKLILGVSLFLKNKTL